MICSSGMFLLRYFSVLLQRFRGPRKNAAYLTSHWSNFRDLSHSQISVRLFS